MQAEFGVQYRIVPVVPYPSQQKIADLDEFLQYCDGLYEPFDQQAQNAEWEKEGKTSP